MTLEAWALDGIGEVVDGTDLVTLLSSAELRDGDVLLVTSKVVSKAEGRVRSGDREEAITSETVRLVARRGPTRIVENHLGLVMAAAGVDASNVEEGRLVLLPEDPDRSARELRSRLSAERGVNLAVVVTDTAGRAWRTGQTDLAIGAAGIEPLEDFAGRTDAYGNALAVTAPAVADELAGVAELVTGKLGGRPVAVVRGLADRVLPSGEDGPGARSLLRPRSQDMFALGAREAVLSALLDQDADCFGAPAAPREVIAVLTGLGLRADARDRSVEVTLPEDPRAHAVTGERVRLLAHALGWRADPLTSFAETATLSPAAP